MCGIGTSFLVMEEPQHGAENYLGWGSTNSCRPSGAPAHGGCMQPVQITMCKHVVRWLMLHAQPPKQQVSLPPAGSRWPKTSLGALKQGQRLTPAQLALLNSICTWVPAHAFECTSAHACPGAFLCMRIPSGCRSSYMLSHQGTRAPRPGSKLLPLAWAPSGSCWPLVLGAVHAHGCIHAPMQYKYNCTSRLTPMPAVQGAVGRVPEPAEPQVPGSACGPAGDGGI